MPDPQRKYTGGTEWEYSVISVSLKLISRVMQAKKSFQSDMYIQPAGHQNLWDHNSSYGTLKVLNMWLKDFLEPSKQARTFPLTLGRPPLLKALDHPHCVQAILVKGVQKCPMETLEPQKICAQGENVALGSFNCPHRLWTVKTQKGTKGPKISMNPKYAIKSARTKMASKVILGQFFKNYGNKPPPFKTIII
ncbi:hypothetical protein O181_111070 [Austropuccinia psidii MF-1]|uniref:Uncharacterized protein n=1 Tax=Austropuccinia psidii MF-1 TaxID=1389203 RepID=A0A9Q3PS61_9BASI|nr:hypothetical protein [Austropuccinia psidii MF-1]